MMSQLFHFQLIPFESQNFEKEGKATTHLKYLRNKQSFLGELFLGHSFGVMYKIAGKSFKT